MRIKKYNQDVKRRFEVNFKGDGVFSSKTAYLNGNPAINFNDNIFCLNDTYYGMLKVTTRTENVNDFNTIYQINVDELHLVVKPGVEIKILNGNTLKEV